MNSELYATEIEYDAFNNITNFIKLDPSTLIKFYSKIENRYIFMQYPNDVSMKRILYDTQIDSNIL